MHCALLVTMVQRSCAFIGVTNKVLQCHVCLELSNFARHADPTKLVILDKRS